MKQTYFARIKRGIGLLACAVLLCGAFRVEAAEEAVKISSEEYSITLNGAKHIFLSNDIPVSQEVGTKVFLTYTVEKVKEDNTSQNGVIAATDNTDPYPYSNDGQLRYKNESLLFEEGYTYAFRFERTESGFDYRCVKMKGSEVISIIFPSQAGKNKTEGYKYYGLWFDSLEGGISATLTHVHCYDQNGKDLGIHFDGRGGILNNQFDVHFLVDSSYSFSLNNTCNVAISNKYPTDSDIIYFEYEVENVTQDDTNQQGLVATSSPREKYPMGISRGHLIYKNYERGKGETPLLREGAKYFIMIKKIENGIDGFVQCTVNGVTEIYAFPSVAYRYTSAYKYFCLWLGESSKSGVTADFKNVKCYDAKGNSLGISLNQSSVQVAHTGKGEEDDYFKSQAWYYCPKNGAFIILSDGKTAFKQTEGVKEEYTYTLYNEGLYLECEDGKESFQYNYSYITDEDGNRYRRLKDCTVTFVTGDNIEKKQVDASNGYCVEEPDTPTKENDVFEGWYLSNGEKFDFDTAVTKSVTLYARWQGDGDLLYQVISHKLGLDQGMFIPIAVSSVIVVGCGVGCLCIARRKRHENKSTQETN